MRNYLKLLFILLITVSFSSCKKNKIGGNANLKGTVIHHDKPIPEAYVYIKYNSKEFPGDSPTNYDTYVKADLNGNFNIPLYRGTYYIYSIGKDLDIPYPNDVKGGLSISIKYNENLQKDIAVTENY